MQLRLLIWLAAEPGTLAPWLALAVSYLVHSLVWTGTAALLVGIRANAFSPATRHLCWKVALFGPLFSAIVAHAATGSVERSPASPVYAREFAVGQPFSSSESSLAWLLGAFGPAAMVLGALRFTGSIYQIRRRLRGRVALTDARLLARVELLRARMGVHRVTLSECDAIGSPLVIGAVEVCLPRGPLAALTDAELDPVLSHELAHLERGDGWWFPVVGALQAVFWLNPLNHWLASRFRESAELACDDRAVELTGNPLGLARALVHVATRAPSARRPSLLPSIGHSKSALLPRVRRLTVASPERVQRTGRRERVWALIIIAAPSALLSMLSIRVLPAQVHAKTTLSSSERSVLADGVSRAMDEQSQRLAELGQRAERVASLLAAADQRPAAAQDGSSEATRVLELSQELRHIRATQLWLEQRLAAAPE